MIWREKISFRSVAGGFSILETVTVLAIIATLGIIAVPYFVRYYQGCCVKVAVTDIAQMFREAKMMSLDEKSHAVVFDVEKGTVALYSESVADGKWNNSDTLLRSFRLKSRGGGLIFGAGSHGPVPGLAEAKDGITFPKNTAVFNERLTGSAGSVYVSASSGVAMAIVVNSVDAGYSLWRWNGRKWVRE